MNGKKSILKYYMKNEFKKFENFFKFYTENLVNSLNNLDLKKIEKSAVLIEKTIKKNGTIFVCGNGGSHSIANHYVCDYFKVLSQQTKLKVKIKSLCSESALISAISNDISYDDVFLYQFERLAEKKDLLILISSSGNSENIKKVLSYSNKKNINSIGLVGFNGGFLKKNSTIPIHIKIKNYGITEDISQIIMHLVMQKIKLKNLIKNIKNPIL